MKDFWSLVESGIPDNIWRRKAVRSRSCLNSCLSPTCFHRVRFVSRRKTETFYAQKEASLVSRDRSDRQLALSHQRLESRLVSHRAPKRFPAHEKDDTAEPSAISIILERPYLCQLATDQPEIPLLLRFLLSSIRHRLFIIGKR